MLLLAKDESTSIINGALVGVLLSQSTSPSVICLSSPRTINLGFLIEGKILLLYSSHLPLEVPNGLVINQASSIFSGAIKQQQWALFHSNSLQKQRDRGGVAGLAPMSPPFF
jgi:hypothetical protein